MVAGGNLVVGGVEGGGIKRGGWGGRKGVGLQEFGSCMEHTIAV